MEHCASVYVAEWDVTGSAIFGSFITIVAVQEMCGGHLELIQKKRCVWGGRVVVSLSIETGECYH